MHNLYAGRLLAAAVILTPTVLVCACAPQSPAALVTSAHSYLAKNDYPAAIIQLKNALQSAPDDAQARFLLGIAYRESGNPTFAEVELRKAHALGYTEAMVVPELARAMVQQGNPSKALSEFATKSLNGASANADLQAAIGEAHLALNESAKSKRAFASARALDPTNRYATLGLAKIAGAEKHLDEALALDEEVLARFPSSVEALTLKADLLAAKGRPGDAIQTYKNALAIKPFYLEAHFSLINLLARQKDFKLARAELDQVGKLAPNLPQTQYFDALVAYGQNDPAHARKSINRVLGAWPDHAPSLLLAGLIEQQLRSYAQAAEYLRKVVSQAPTWEYPRRLLVGAYLQAGELDLATEAFAPLEQHASRDPAVLALGGELFFARNDVEKALRYFEQAAALEPKNAALRTRLGELRFGAGDISQAIADLEVASAADAQQYTADLALVALHLKQGEATKAVTALQKLEQKQPDNPLTLDLKGYVYIAQGDRARARASFERALQLAPTHLPAVYHLALLDIQDQQPQRARSRYDAVLAKEPSNDTALLGLAKILSATGASPSEIDAVLIRAIAANPEARAARLALIDLRLNAKDFKGALTAAQEARAALPDDLKILEALGIAQQSAGDMNQARGTFTQLTAALPKSSSPILRQAQLALASKDYETALQALRRAVETHPELLALHADIINIYLVTNRVSEAVADARAVQKRHPENALGFLLEAEVMSRQNKGAETQRALRAALQRASSPAIVIALHRDIRRGGKAPEADAFADAWASAHPTDMAVLVYLGDELMSRGAYPEAIQRYKLVLERQPNNPVALNNLAWALHQSNDPRALEYAEKAFTLAQDNALILDTLGWILGERGNTRRAIEMLHKASNIAPDIPLIRLHLAKVLVKGGEKEAARRELQALAQLSDNPPIQKEAATLLSTL